MTRLPRDVIKRHAQDRLPLVLRALGIDAPLRGGSIAICNPIRGESRPSLQIWIKPGYEGAWKDHGAGLSGDIFDLVAYFKGWEAKSADGFAKACDWLAATLGLSDTAAPRSDDERTRAIEAAARDRRLREQAERDRVNRGIAKAIWLKASEDLTPLAPYFLNRGVDLRKLKRPPGALRVFGADTRYPHKESGRALPGMIACMQTQSDIVAVHRTYMTPDFSQKCSAIGITPARKIWPTFTGAFIPLARGASDLPVRIADEQGIADDLVLAEGIEKGLAVAVADHGPRVWAFGSLANLAHVPVPRCASSIIVAADNDVGNARAQALLDRGLEHLHTFGVPVSVMRAPIGKDVDEFLKAGESDDDEHQ
jgi:hypothetical protein